MWNLLNLASRLIPTVTAQYRIFTGSVLNEAGIEINTYSEAITIKNAHVQPLKAEMYAQYELQPSQNAKVCYIPANVAGTVNKTSNDIIIFQGKRFNIFDTHDWYDYDGWNKLIIVEDKDYAV
jgi:hypothetical protein